MSIPRNSNKPNKAMFVVIAAAVLMFGCCLLSSLMTSSTSAPRNAPTARNAAASAQGVPAANPIENMLRHDPRGPRTEGIAMVVLMDTSGSMAESVGDVNYSRSPKIEIARRAATSLISKTEEFVRAHPEKNILLGLYEFSRSEEGDSPRKIVPLGAPNVAAARDMIARMKPHGDTPIGDALIEAKRDLDATGRTSRHIIVVTDGQNTSGYEPGDVMRAISRLPEEDRPNVYFVAFDVSASRFNEIRDCGGLVMSAADGHELEQALDYVLTGKILAEQPEPSASRQSAPAGPAR